MAAIKPAPAASASVFVLEQPASLPPAVIPDSSAIEERSRVRDAIERIVGDGRAARGVGFVGAGFFGMIAAIEHFGFESSPVVPLIMCGCCLLAAAIGAGLVHLGSQDLQRLAGPRTGA